MYCKHLYYVFRFLCNVGENNDKFIHTPMRHMNLLVLWSVGSAPSVMFNRMFDNVNK